MLTDEERTTMFSMLDDIDYFRKKEINMPSDKITNQRIVMENTFEIYKIELILRKLKEL